MQPSNTIHINPNFLNQCNGERQHIHINPSFVQGPNSKILYPHFKSTTDINNTANMDNYEICKNDETSFMSLGYNSEVFHFANSALPATSIVPPRSSTFSVKSLPVEMKAKSRTLPAFNNVSPSSNLSKEVSITTKFCGEKVAPLSSSAPQMYQRNSKYKLDRMKTTKYNLITNYANWSIQPKTTSNYPNSIKTVNHDSKASFLVEKDAHYDYEFQLKNKATLPDHLQIQNYTRPIGSYKNKYAINRIANNTANAFKTFKCDTKQKMTSDIAVLPPNSRLSATTLKLPIGNSLTKKEVTELKTLQSSFKLNNSKIIINSSFPKMQPTFQKGSRPTYTIDNNAVGTLGGGNNVKHANNSRYKLILNSDNKFISGSDKQTEANNLASASKPTFSSSNFALKSRTKIIRERSASSIYYQNLKKNKNSDSWCPCDQNKKTASSMIKQTPKSVKKGTLFKAHQNLLLKKFNKFHSRPMYAFHSSKYKICRPDKLKLDVVKKYVIKRKCNASNFKKEKDIKINNEPIQSLSFTQNKGKGDLISTYKIMRHRPNQNSKKIQQCAYRDLVSRYKINRKAYLTSKKLLQPCNRSRRLSYSVTRRRSLHRPKSEKFVNIGGSMFKSTRTSLKIQGTIKNINDSGNFSRSSKAISGLNNSRFKLNKSQSLVKSLCVSKPGMLTEIVRLQKLGLFKKRNEFCMFYIRFGKCRRKEDGICPFVHDPDKIAICTRFLRGSCKVVDCPFSHKLDKSKMPVCSHFLNGTCHKDDCLYRHVNVNPKAPVCRNFLRGHCPHGEECKKKHILICEDFQSTGKCSLGAQCPLSHRMEKNRAKSVSQTTVRKRQTPVVSITSGNVNSKRRVSGKVGVLGMLKLKQGEVTMLKKKSKTASKRYFEPKNLAEDLHAEDHVSLHQGNEPNSSNYIFELKKKRLLKKVEKMKSLYSVGFENDGNNKVTSLDNLDSHCNSTIETNTPENFDEDVNFSSWRVPLPDVLPSFIPLVMPRLDGNT